ncbi:sigma-54-dependent Fis family transcriptional regulator [Salinisphaera sp. Q1T1-3]|nr:sigma-54-dependent Fis family transcriptional regulator [Salinisphaera sp. Q1T1-3]
MSGIGEVVSVNANLDAQQIRALAASFERHDLYALSADAAAGALSVFGSPGTGRRRLVFRLADGSGDGFAIADISPDQPRTSSETALRDAALAPLAQALRNHRRSAELDQLRARIDADRESLLQRLGRHTLRDRIVGEDGGLRDTMRQANAVAGSDTTVLLLGATGTGKEVIARSIHDRSSRAEAPFIRVNCGAIPAELIDSELFGHEKGSFTGAIRHRRGWFERADGGTLFLDEIGELPLPAQVRLLRVLQDHTFQRVGGEQEIRSDVRIVAATHRDLVAMVSQGQFRADLWYRIAIFPIRIPRLADRADDIAELAQHIARRVARRLGLPEVLPSDADMVMLRHYDWPGNVREMMAVIERAAILGDGRELALARALGFNMPTTVAGEAEIARPMCAEPLDDDAADWMSLDEAMCQHIIAALRHCRGRVHGPGGAAQLLDINPSTLRARLRKHGLAAGDYR